MLVNAADGAYSVSQQPAPLVVGGARRSRIVGGWLLLCSVFVFAMVIVGGLTRLTESGLSMVDWAPITGVLPPTNDAEWQALFTRYQASPEYQKVNQHLDLEGFKGIFWLEYIHRVLGRVTGMVVLVPLLVFAARRWLSRRLVLRVVGLFALGGLQGALGWFMVKSGLVDVPRVSPYRLAAHLSLALALYGAVLWSAWDLLLGRAPAAFVPRGARRLLGATTAAAGLTVVWGAFVAGLDAGLVYNTWPLMGDGLVPSGMASLSPGWANAFENMVTVQFVHRTLAYLTVAASLVSGIWGWRRARGGQLRWLFGLLPVVALLQMSLGIATLLTQVRIEVASLHQAVGVLLLSVILLLWHRLRGASAASG